MTAAAQAPERIPSRPVVPLWWGVDAVPDSFGPCVVTVGVFDGVHRGHRRLIDHARAVGRARGLPVVLLTFDPHPARVLGIDRDTAVLTTVDRRAELAAAAGVDAVCVLRFTAGLAARTPDEFARDVLARGLGAAAVVVGANFTFGARAAGDVTTLATLGTGFGFSTHVVPLLRVVDAPCSSTHARRCIRSGRLDAAARALGRPHRVDGARRGDVVRPEPGTALPPPGRYHGLVDGRAADVEVLPDGQVRIVAAAGDRPSPDGPVSVVFAGDGGALR
ncbi:cytidyltransferase [Pseudonocardia alni]|jgi:riboflavin kinase/FMN adenylyltransferase|nr:Riboflavin biosynthesis protein RibF [Pseudonocardia autotrophica]